MRKKVVILVLTFCIFAGGFAILSVIRYRQNLRIARQKAKAEEISIKFVEGWTLRDIANYLEQNKITSKAEFLRTAAAFNVSGYPILKSLPKITSLEGFVFPDTYFILKNPAPNTNVSETIIKKALDNFEKKVTPQLAQKKSSLSFYDTITLASIIEKETGSKLQTKQEIEQERFIVAGIFYNRLNIGMPLQSDATVNFATGKNSFQASQDDILIDSPYNTYKYLGLPPGPINNPSLSAIIAALSPAKTDYMYFLTDPKTGQAIYAKTYEEHLKNKRKYLDNK